MSFNRVEIKIIIMIIIIIIIISFLGYKKTGTAWAGHVPLLFSKMCILHVY